MKTDMDRDTRVDTRREGQGTSMGGQSARDAGQLHNDRISAAVILAVIVAFVVMLIWLGTVGAPPIPTDAPPTFLP